MIVRPALGSPGCYIVEDFTKEELKNLLVYIKMINATNIDIVEYVINTIPLPKQFALIYSHEMKIIQEFIDLEL